MYILLTPLFLMDLVLFSCTVAMCHSSHLCLVYASEGQENIGGHKMQLMANSKTYSA